MFWSVKNKMIQKQDAEAFNVSKSNEYEGWAHVECTDQKNIDYFTFYICKDNIWMKICILTYKCFLLILLIIYTEKSTD